MKKIATIIIVIVLSLVMSGCIHEADKEAQDLREAEIESDLSCVMWYEAWQSCGGDGCRGWQYYFIVDGLDVCFVDRTFSWTQTSDTECKTISTTTGRLIFNETLSNDSVNSYMLQATTTAGQVVIVDIIFYFYNDSTIRATHDGAECTVYTWSDQRIAEWMSTCGGTYTKHAPQSTARPSPSAAPAPTRDVVRDMVDDLGKSTRDEISELEKDLHVDLSDFSDIIDKVQK